MVEMSQSTLVGIDFGKRSDFSALVILERLALEPGGPRQPGRVWPPSRPWTPATYIGHTLHRWELGTPYTAIVQDVQGVLASGRLPPPVTLLVDGTGPGVAVLDLFDVGMTRPPPIGIVVTNGSTTTQPRPNEWHTPKSSLVVHLQAAAEARPVRLVLGPRLPFLDAVKTEMQSFSAETTPATGYVRYEAARQQDHDDLLFALGLCLWWGDMFGDTNWSFNVDVRAAMDGTWIRRRRIPGSTRRLYADDLPPGEDQAEPASWDEAKRLFGEGKWKPSGPYQPERRP
jgi:hypothetical protein